MRDLVGADPKPASRSVAALSPDPKAPGKEFQTFLKRTAQSRAKGSNNALNGAANVKKYCSTAEVGGPASESCGTSSRSAVSVRTLTCALCRSKLSRNSWNLRATSAARVVAKALGEQGPAGEAILQKSALLQVTNLISLLGGGGLSGFHSKAV